MAGRCRFGPGSSAENLITRWRYHNSRAAWRWGRGGGSWRRGGGRGSANKITGWRNSIPGALRIANWTLRSRHEVQQQSEARAPRLLARRPPAAMAQVHGCRRDASKCSLRLLAGEVSSTKLVYQLELWEVFSRTNRTSSHTNQRGWNLDHICYNRVIITSPLTDSNSLKLDFHDLESQNDSLQLYLNQSIIIALTPLPRLLSNIIGTFCWTRVRSRPQ